MIQEVGDDSDHIIASAGDDLEMECIATGGNPPPTLRWFADDVEIRTGHTQENSRPGGSKVRTWTSISRLVLPVSKSDDGATIRCEAEHPALQEPLSARKLLTIHCKCVYAHCKHMTLKARWFHMFKIDLNLKYRKEKRTCILLKSDIALRKAGKK